MSCSDPLWGADELKKKRRFSRPARKNHPVQLLADKASPANCSHQPLMGPWVTCKWLHCLQSHQPDTLKTTPAEINGPGSCIPSLGDFTWSCLLWGHCPNHVTTEQRDRAGSYPKGLGGRLGGKRSWDGASLCANALLPSRNSPALPWTTWGQLLPQLLASACWQQLHG